FVLLPTIKQCEVEMRRGPAWIDVDGALEGALGTEVVELALINQSHRIFNSGQLHALQLRERPLGFVIKLQSDERLRGAQFFERADLLVLRFQRASACE